jgi:hypothetical protein
MLWLVAALGRYGDAPIQRIRDRSQFVFNAFSTYLFKVIISQVAVKSLLIYVSDPLMEKKTKVSIPDRTLQISFTPDIAVL